MVAIQQRVERVLSVNVLDVLQAKLVELDTLEAHRVDDLPRGDLLEELDKIFVAYKRTIMTRHVDINTSSFICSRNLTRSSLPREAKRRRDIIHTHLIITNR